MNGWIFSGSLVEKNLLGRKGYSAKPRHQASLGYDPKNMFVDKDAGLDVRRKLGWSDTVPVVGYLGRFVEDKGLKVLMASLDQLKKPWYALFVGNGPLRGDLESWAAKYSSQVAIRTEVKHEDVRPYINAMDMLAAPSLTMPNWREQFGRMTVEAFACGVPVIGSDSGEIPFVIRDTGIIIPENNANALATALETLMDDREHREDIVQRGLERANAEFTWSGIARGTLGFFDELLEQNHKPNVLVAPSKPANDQPLIKQTLASKSTSLLAISTLGSKSNEESRILALLSKIPQVVAFPFDRTLKIRMIWKLLAHIKRNRPQLVVMEGTGFAGGFSLLVARLFLGQRYVVSSGDAVGPWVATKSRLLAPLFGLYERLLYKCASGFIGWTPYLVGRALTFGVPRAMTAAGWAPFTRTIQERHTDRDAIRKHLGIEPTTLVIGIAGSLVWSKRVGYCYGWELVQAAIECKRDDVCWLIVGDGDGKSRLEQAADKVIHGRVLFTGRIPQAELPAYLAAIDIGSLPQSVDRVGSFRYTTKISEYLAYQLPFVTGQIPLAYDLSPDWLWRLPGNAPWDRKYIVSLARLVEQLSVEQVHLKRDAIPEQIEIFDRQTQIERTTAFIRDLLERNSSLP